MPDKPISPLRQRLIDDMTARHYSAGKAACTVRAHAPPGQDAPRLHRPEGVRHPDTYSATFNFLGFSHIWAKSEGGERGEASDGQKPVRP